MDVNRRAVALIGLVVFLLTATVYLITLTPTVPFWDSGEFIAVSYILGIPHPPGTPFYVLLGRIATMVPWATIAQRVNALSAIAGALAVLLTYLTGLRLIRLIQGPNRGRSDEWIAVIGAATGALLLAFSDSFWENSIEAEVYSLMSLAQILVLWLGLKWWEAHEKQPTAGPLLVCVYVMWLCVGLHLGVGIMGLPLMVLVWMVDRRAALVFSMPLLSVLLVTMGLERMAGGVMLLSTITFMAFGSQQKLDSRVVWSGAVASLIGMFYAFTDRDFTPLSALLALAAVVVPLAFLARRSREGKIIALALLLMVVGYSTHLYLPIRAAQHPAINEGDPANWSSLRDLLERKQYGSSSMLERRGPWSAQLDKEFWRYFRRQWPLFHTDRLWGGLLPLALGLAGAIWNARRERITFLTMGCFVGLTTAGMIVFLNFTDHEVRERDYFFQSGYHAYALWIGIGAAWLISWVRDSFERGRVQDLATASCAVIMLAQPVLLMRNLWYTHDRRGSYIADDYAYNMLAPLERDSYVFTNGDNDTFPLWYIQEVEGFRKDVRVVNLSLLNTDWYIKQLRDEEPKLPITLDDAAIRELGQGIVPLQGGGYMYTNRFMVGHLIDNNKRPDGRWKKQPYFAVTVPEHMGFDRYFSLEGLVYRVNPDTLQDSVDEPTTRRALYQTFRYRGLFKEDGSWDNTVYKDENASTLSHNYAAAHLQLAFWYRRHQQLPRGIAEMERVARMFPGFTDVVVPLGNFYLDAGETTKAVALFERLTATDPLNPEAHYYYGVTHVFRGHLDSAIAAFETAIQLDPNYSQAYYAAYYALAESGQRERALGYLERWVRSHPSDSAARALLDGQRGMGVVIPGQKAPLLPRPPISDLP
jgi:transmembrane protein TMEM260 (protein O-mannosyltransferase)/tetratricopeptide repeat protein